MGRRLDIASIYAERIAGRVDPRQVMDAVSGSTLSAETARP